MTSSSLLEVGGRTHRGGRSGPNEDAYALVPDGNRLGAFLADGMGGRPGGRVAARAGVRAAAAKLPTLATDTKLEVAALLCAHAALDAVLGERGRRSDLPNMAATFVGLVADGSCAAIAWLGDSRAYLVRAHTAQGITTDHMIDLGATPVVTRYLGSSAAKADVVVVELHLGDRLVLCTDGIFGDLDRPERHIARAVGSARAIEGARRLVADALNRKTTDNATAVVIAVGPPAAEFSAREVWRLLRRRLSLGIHASTDTTGV